MILNKYATPEQVKTAREYQEKVGGVGHRGDFDGDKIKQLFGLQAQMIVAEMLGVNNGLDSEGFDGGYDLEWNNKKWDVKCELRTVNFKPRKFVHNVAASQIRYQAEGFIFCSMNRTEGLFQVCGYITKEDFLEKATFYPQGTERERTDGTKMTVMNNGGMYELEQKHLEEFQ